MKILHILNHIQETGNGIVNVAVDLACLQAQAGHSVGVASAGGKYQNLLERYGVQHFSLDQTRRPANLLLAARRYRRVVQDFQPEIVHAHMMTGVTLARALRYGHSYTLISTVHNEFQRSAIWMGLADGVIAVSQAVAEAMAQRGIPQAKLRVVRNGTLGSPRRRGESASAVHSLNHPAIATVAGMYHRKGIADLIAAFERVAPQVPTAHLYLIGDGPDRAEFETQVQRTQVRDRIHFEGFQPEPQRYLRAADVFVLASHKDPFPLVLPEAREAGCAIVASRVDGIPEALEQGQAGILVPPKDPMALAEALMKLLSNLETLQFWRRQAQENISWLSAQRVCTETQNIYREFHRSP
ncbi:glycosyltransferase family 4 protein [Leptolyngbya sp. KIOST-1]|uniref:glycosyltransferase family 4 protein n=1 Tax=Leptolyngbya sp. KIOST-1 TaxID=1229172 RepID=UPI0005665674|nr:glycosyltransferase family 4 protein [Leptolyngbya sp. KIOST-1]